MPQERNATQGQYRGDFSRDTFDPTKQFLRVLLQQGRVQVDADWNEQVSILLHYLQALAADVIGDHGGIGESFAIKAGPAGDFKITAGRYYVDGILCELETDVNYTKQEFLPAPLKDDGIHLVYLDVWERHVTHLEADVEQQPGVREVALGGPDTATRSQVVWQVRTWTKDRLGQGDALRLFEEDHDSHTREGMLKAIARRTAAPTGGCSSEPESAYRGTENQLYRVEIHRGGTAWDGTDNGRAGAATFKWSRENGSVVFPITDMTVGVDGVTIKLGDLGRDARLGLAVNDWVEVVTNSNALALTPTSLLQVEVIDRETSTIIARAAGTFAVSSDDLTNAVLRRWDHQAGDSAIGGLTLDEGAALLTESAADWLSLEDGVQIQFQPPKTATPHHYDSGDYWLIPARAATGDIEWPKETDAQGAVVTDADGSVPLAVPPRGILRHYAPLAIISVDATGKVTVEKTLRNSFKPLTLP